MSLKFEHLLQLVYVPKDSALVWNTFQGGGSDCFARWLTRD